MQSVFCLNSKKLFQQYADVVRKILFILLSTLDLEHIKVFGGLVFASPPFRLSGIDW